MKQIIFLATMLFSIACNAQYAGILIGDNALIYPDSTLNRLKRVSDSLTLKCKTEPPKAYKSKAQAKAHFIQIGKSRSKEALLDIEANIPFEDFVKKYKTANVDRDVLVVKSRYKDDDGQSMVDFSNVQFVNDGEYILTFEDDQVLYDKPKKGKWLFKFIEADKYWDSGDSLMAFYFTGEFETAALPAKYTALAQYVDCLIDPSSDMLSENAHVSYEDICTDPSSRVCRFIEYVHAANQKPDVINIDDWIKAAVLLREWESKRMEKADELKRRDPKFNVLMDEALKAAKAGAVTDDEFHNYIERYYPPAEALALKRNKKVLHRLLLRGEYIQHAIHLARLSAKALNWNVFIRAHIAFLGEEFVDSHDKDQLITRYDYSKELEALDLNLPDLLLGSCLAVEGAGPYHHSIDVWRAAAVFVSGKSSVRKEVEQKLLDMISDKELDDYNRSQMYFVYEHISERLVSEVSTKNDDRLAVAVGTLPTYLKKRIEVGVLWKD